MAGKALDLDAVRRIAMALAGVEEHAMHGAPSWKTRGKLLASPAIHKSAEPHSLMVRISPADRSQLLAADPETYYLTDHYRSHCVVLVRLAKTDWDSLENLLHRAWLFVRSSSKR